MGIACKRTVAYSHWRESGEGISEPLTLNPPTLLHHIFVSSRFLAVEVECSAPWNSLYNLFPFATNTALNTMHLLKFLFQLLEVSLCPSHWLSMQHEFSPAFLKSLLHWFRTRNSMKRISGHRHVAPRTRFEIRQHPYVDTFLTANGTFTDRFTVRWKALF